MVTVENTSDEIAEADPQIAILPVGSLEQHGEHLPIATDWVRADDMGRRIAEAMDEEVYLLPAIAYANSQEHMDMAGTITLRPSTLALVIEDIVLSLRHHGIRRVVIFTTHGGNWILKPTIRDLNFRQEDLRIIHADGPVLSKGDETPGELHAGRGETAGMLAIRPDLVKGRSPDHAAPFGKEWLDYAGMGALTETGAWGEPSKAAGEDYEQSIQRAVEHRVAYIRETFERLDEVLGPLAGE